MPRNRNPKLVRLPVDFEAHPDHVVAVIPIDPLLWAKRPATIGLRFESPEHLLEFFDRMMVKACQVWPENEWIQEYMREE